MRTLFLNPPSFEGFDGGAGSRWPASREIESYWYPVWLAYPAGMLEDSKLVDAPPHKISIEQTVAMAKDFELMVLFTSSPGFHVDIKISEMMKDANPKLRVAFVGPPVTVEPEKALNASKSIDFVVRREFDHQIANYAKGTPLSELPGVSYRKNGDFVHNPEGGVIENLDELPWVTRFIKKISISAVTMFLSCYIPTFPSTPRAAVRRCARSACGLKRTPATAGDCVHRWTSRMSAGTFWRISRA
jgi:hypothetical protein